MPTLTRTDEAVPNDLPEIASGQDYSWSFAVTNPDGSPVNLAGMSYACKMRADGAESRTVIFTPTMTVASNVVTLSLTKATTGAVTASRQLFYDINQTDSVGNVLPLFKGKVFFRLSVTR